jgi:hypothetical protein
MEGFQITAVENKKGSRNLGEPFFSDQFVWILILR